MKAVIVGCGRVGAGLADELDRAGWQVLILDLTSAAFDRLPSTFGGTALRGDGTDEDVLRRAGAEDADLFLALTEGDNRNVMAAQLGVEELGAQQDGRQDQRPGARRGLCAPGHRDPVPHQPDVRRGVAVRWARRCRSARASTAATAHEHPIDAAGTGAAAAAAAAARPPGRPRSCS